MSADPNVAPWLTIVGLGEDGADGLPPASLKALQDAEIIMGAKRHLGLLPEVSAELIEWPVPFADGLSVLKSYKGRRTVALASGDPFWHGAGTSITRDMNPAEWHVLPAVGTMSHAAAKLGWALESTPCFGLHAAPFARLRPHLSEGQRLLCTMRDGQAVKDLGNWLDGAGFGASAVHVLEALGGPRERVRTVTATQFPDDIAHPVSVGLEVAGDGAHLPLTSGRPDSLFANDGQITKRPVRALTLSALAPKHGEHLWDIGGGSGSISIEWLLAHPSLSATAFEIDETRAERIAENAAEFGVTLSVVTGAAPAVLCDVPKPDVVFIGGGISAEMLDWLWGNLAAGTRLVANGVTLEAEILLAQWHASKGGDLMRFEVSESKPLGSKRGWKASYPIVQWSVTL
ncbi:precorrin-6y C5,15-methyltransferase (decarboxylating) subunit CbiE [Cognatishimia activa]|uniref:precorrin-6y C5,15-methyltransferase (decarboxylating) subunit CbiE n=1 Tax=Cognatishimia activa TaxID=1715691 RepID=UPI002231273C|nr:precorrin-6y C5,15-methyltransferase (decarboxylating) subunit CbiE [Cognatishimia activa]UZD91531.1 precorrin-6y C5,15-methyltransferase (decarboxylating) subunit CbiE [Cognatishimia activa]